MTQKNRTSFMNDPLWKSIMAKKLEISQASQKDRQILIFLVYLITTVLNQKRYVKVGKFRIFKGNKLFCQDFQNFQSSLLVQLQLQIFKQKLDFFLR